MVTYLPFPSYRKSVECLDDQRLRKQRNDVLQLLIILKWDYLRLNIWLAELVLPDPGVVFTQIAVPCEASILWEGYSNALVAYGLEACNAWRTRGNVDRLYDKIDSFTEEDIFPEQSWLEQRNLCPKISEELHWDHQQLLLKKLPSHYKGIFSWKW